MSDNKSPEQNSDAFSKISLETDIIIVSTNTRHQEEFWQARLKEMRGTSLSPNTFVIAVTEDWPGGAGNGLGTLFAYHKAQEKAKFMYRTDLFKMQKSGASVTIYHTAGQGKRLFPITASELNDKSCLKLPGTIDKRQITLLEAVIAQTNKLASQRKGRLSVFWGDQIFVSNNLSFSKEEHHIDIIGRNTPFANESDWNKMSLSNYGLLAIGQSGQISLLEKIDYNTLVDLISKNKISADKGIATSLGSFSLSPQMTFALLREFETEIDRRKGKLDSDPHFWMPLTLDQETYLDLMTAKGASRDIAREHYERMHAFKTKFCRLHSDKDFMNIIDLGTKSYWWDYGSIKSYYDNILKLTSMDREGQAMRLFYKIDPNSCRDMANRVIKDEGSCLIDCNIRSGKIINSVLIGVNAVSLEAKNCIIVNSRLSSVQASYSLFYNIEEEKDIKFSPGTIRADVKLPGKPEKLTLYSHQGRNGKTDWQTLLPQNPMSYEQAYQKIRSEIHEYP